MWSAVMPFWNEVSIFRTVGMKSGFVGSKNCRTALRAEAEPSRALSGSDQIAERCGRLSTAHQAVSKSIEREPPRAAISVLDCVYRKQDVTMRPAVEFADAQHPVEHEVHVGVLEPYGDGLRLKISFLFAICFAFPVRGPFTEYLFGEYIFAE